MALGGEEEPLSAICSSAPLPPQRCWVSLQQQFVPHFCPQFIVLHNLHC